MQSGGTVSKLVGLNRLNSAIITSLKKNLTCQGSSYPLDWASDSLIELLLLCEDWDVVSNDTVNHAISHFLQHRCNCVV